MTEFICGECNVKIHVVGDSADDIVLACHECQEVTSFPKSEIALTWHSAHDPVNVAGMINGKFTQGELN